MEKNWKRANSRPSEVPEIVSAWKLHLVKIIDFTFGLTRIRSLTLTLHEAKCTAVTILYLIVKKQEEEEEEEEEEQQQQQQQ